MSALNKYYEKIHLQIPLPDPGSATS
jgi:hypothetical protein